MISISATMDYRAGILHPGGSVTKREVLSRLTRENLIDLAEAYDVSVDRTWPKDALVQTLVVSRHIKTEGLVDLSNKIKELGNVSSAVLRARQGFFDETAAVVFEQIESLSDSLSTAIAAAEIIDPGYSSKLRKQLDEIADGRIFKVDPVPDHIWSQLTGKQRGAFGTAKRLAYQIPRFIEDTIQLSSETDFVKEQVEWRSRHLPERVEYYLLQAHRAYVSRCYDASIVMVARAIEHILKKKLADATIKIPDKASLGKLIEVFRRGIGNNRCLEKVLEVSNMDRVISAHDIPPYDKVMEQRDADLAWAAFGVIFRDLS